MGFITFENVGKLYGDFRALGGVNLTLDKNKIYGLLGRNGAGKTTLINILSNRIFLSEGRVLVEGENAQEDDFVQGKIFCMTEKGSYPPEIRAKKSLYWAKQFNPQFDSEYAKGLVKKFNLDINKKIGQLSTGNATILKAIMTLASGAEIMIFDEPTLGLDAGHRELFYKEMLLRQCELENTVVLSTHLISEIESIVEHVVIIKDGGVIADSGVEIMIFDEPTLGLDAGHRELFYKEMLLRQCELENTVVLSTHLISEIESIVEHVVIIKDGGVIADSSVEDILSNAYCVCGGFDKVAAFCEGKRVIKESVLGSIKSVTIFERLTDADKMDIKKRGLELVTPQLQEIFVSLTSNQGDNND